ncbi:hypothetical protein [Sulfitobacter sp. R18_1]|uniref:hypothetical protein n=1 Tax=Sulfitobacter sp. R18_1 TaxID=2821104 RepID=UPI001AD9B2FB|nr:hypothetical protein [Sulfitobacter sp. R18_1]MBO9428814.1 hypothetical protein [Sulfitobacter sp. R18_1]
MHPPNMYESYIVRYRPSWNAKAQLQLRTHDLSGTDYEHMKYLEPKELLDLDPELRAEFLYDDERVKFLEDHPDLIKKDA